MYSKPRPELLQLKEVQAELKQVPFTEPPPGPYKRDPIREIVRIRLRKDMKIPAREIKYMKEHPEDMEWLERKVKPRFWSNFLAQIESLPKEEEEKGNSGVYREFIPFSSERRE